AVAALPALATFINDVMPQANVQGAAQRMVDEANRILEQTRLGLGPLAEKWIDTLSGVADGVPDSVTGFLATLTTAVDAALGGEGAAAEFTASLQSVSVWRVTASLFGSNVPDPAVDPATGKPPGTALPIALDEDTKGLFLDQAHEAIRPASFALVQWHEGGRTQ